MNQQEITRTIFWKDKPDQNELRGNCTNLENDYVVDQNIMWDQIQAQQVFYKPPKKSIEDVSSATISVTISDDDDDDSLPRPRETKCKAYNRFVCISDTHGQHRNGVRFPPSGDVLIHAGDFTTSREIGTVIDFVNYFWQYHCKY